MAPLISYQQQWDDWQHDFSNSLESVESNTGSFQINLNQMNYLRSCYLGRIVELKLQPDIDEDSVNALAQNVTLWHADCLQAAIQKQDDPTFRLFGFAPVPESFNCSLSVSGSRTPVVKNMMTLENQTDRMMNTVADVKYALQQSVSTTFKKGIALGVSGELSVIIDLGVDGEAFLYRIPLNLNFEHASTNTDTKENLISLSQSIKIPPMENRFIVVKVFPLTAQGSYSCRFNPEYTTEARTSSYIGNTSFIETVLNDVENFPIDFLYLQQEGDLYIKGGFDARVVLSKELPVVTLV